MFQQEGAKGCGAVEPGKVLPHAGGVPSRTQRLFIGLEGLIVPLAKSRLELFLGHIPDPRLFVCAVEIDASSPGILRIDSRNGLGDAGPPVNAVGHLLIGMHAGGKLVDDLAIRLHH